LNLLSEQERAIALSVYENKARKKGFSRIAGIDEAGRGPLAGPVVAAACILPEGLFLQGIDDSKKLTKEKREELYALITQDPSIEYGVGVVDALMIDQINILQATLRAMIAAVAYLRQKPDYLLVDGRDVPDAGVTGRAIIEGDRLSQSIAAASVIAKVTRDRMMLSYHQEWPQYGFDEHKGYGTPKHVLAIEQFGPCPIHRMSFEPLKSRVVPCEA
jgi:ribonuclease HII